MPSYEVEVSKLCFTEIEVEADTQDQAEAEARQLAAVLTDDEWLSCNVSVKCWEVS
jgi:hypothetical protein